jgi:hypothetical protein
MRNAEKRYSLVGADGKKYDSEQKGTLGGYSNGKRKYYGRLDCKSALGFVAKGHYVKYRVFFADEAAAIAAGYRPCRKCMRAEYDAHVAKFGKPKY